MSASVNWVAWKSAIGVAELLALLGVFDRFVEAALGTAERAGADVDAPAVEAHHRDPEAFALGADAVGDGHPDLVEIDLGGRLRMPAELLLLRAETDALHILFDNQAVMPFGPSSPVRTIVT